MAIDSTTEVMCMTTQEDMDVEFYSLRGGQGFAMQIPCKGGALTNGAPVAVDPVNHRFVVAQQNWTFSPVVPHLTVNPNNRVGYVNGPNGNQIQEFTY